MAPGGREVDDGIALLQAFASPELDIRGISVVFGNADLATAEGIAREMAARFAPHPVQVHAGAARRQDLGRATPASRALARELRRHRLTVLALGPVTNVGTLLRNHPELAGRIEQVIAVAGRRPGQRFQSGPAQKVPFRDLNFELDPEAMRVLLTSGVPLVLAPWEISSQVWLTREDIAAAAARHRGMAWMLTATNDWLTLWRERFGAPGFNPFDALAVGYLVDRQDLSCGTFSAAIETGPDDTATDTKASAPDKPYLLVRPAAGGRTVTYCSAPKPGFKRDLLRRLSR